MQIINLVAHRFVTPFTCRHLSTSPCRELYQNPRGYARQDARRSMWNADFIQRLIASFLRIAERTLVLPIRLRNAIRRSGSIEGFTLSRNRSDVR